MGPTGYLPGIAIGTLLALSPSGCDAPSTRVVVDNRFSPSANSYVIYRAFWQAVSFTMPIAPGSSSDPADTIAASDNTAYVVLAPGWDPVGPATPTSFILLQSDHGFSVHSNQTLHIPIDDLLFSGNCAAGRPLEQAQADFLTQRVFVSVFDGLRYDAATCSTTSLQ
jgi:hypothetical protein